MEKVGGEVSILNPSYVAFSVLDGGPSTSAVAQPVVVHNTHQPLVLTVANVGSSGKPPMLEAPFGLEVEKCLGDPSMPGALVVHNTTEPLAVTVGIVAICGKRPL